MNKTCSKCKVEKLVSEFAVNDKYGRLRSMCNPCEKIRRKVVDQRYREKNRERVRDNGRRWQQANKDVGARWYEAHREEILEKSRKERAEANNRNTSWLEARLALAKRQEERAGRQKRYGAKREAAKALTDKGMKVCATCGEEKPVSSFGVVTFSSGTKGSRSNCYECRRADWNNATEEEKAERREILNERIRISRGKFGLRIWIPPRLCSIEGCNNKHSTRGLCTSHDSRLEAENLTDKYVSDQLSKRGGIKNPPAALIKLKRVQIKIRRALKNEHT
jgi:hypothetical protein